MYVKSGEMNSFIISIFRNSKNSRYLTTYESEIR